MANVIKSLANNDWIMLVLLASVKIIHLFLVAEVQNFDISQKHCLNLRLAFLRTLAVTYIHILIFF
jgi:hypothetical protein